jgi:hypothetical protein
MTKPMHRLAQHSSVVNAPADQIWAIIAAYGSESLWMPTCLTSSLEGFGIGSVRSLVLRPQPDVVVRERLLTVDPVKRTMRFDVQRDDLQGVRSLCDVSLEEVGEGGTRVTYATQTDLEDEELERMIAPGLEGMFRGMVDSIAQKLET